MVLAPEIRDVFDHRSRFGNESRPIAGIIPFRVLTGARWQPQSADAVGCRRHESSYSIGKTSVLWIMRTGPHVWSRYVFWMARTSESHALHKLGRLLWVGCSRCRAIPVVWLRPPPACSMPTSQGRDGNGQAFSCIFLYVNWARWTAKRAAAVGILTEAFQRGKTGNVEGPLPHAVSRHGGELANFGNDFCPQGLVVS